MGNLSVKGRDEEGIIFTSRSPLRNRSVKDMKKRHSKKKLEEPKIVKNNFLKVAPTNLERQRQLKAEAKKSEPNKEPYVKVRRQEKHRKDYNEEVPKEKEKKASSAKNIDKNLSIPLENQVSLEMPSTNDTHLLSEVIKMVVELERSFLEERKYQRRLRSGVSKQNQTVHHLQLSLHAEKERNKRLMEILSQGDSLPSCSLEQSSNTTNTTEKPGDLKPLGSWIQQAFLANSLNRPISPMLLQQRSDELQSSLLRCQRELKHKDNLLAVALCKQETLQAKCEKLSEQYLALQRKLASMNRIKVQKKGKRKSTKSETSETSKESGAKNRRKRSNRGCKINAKPYNWDAWEKEFDSKQPVKLGKTKGE